MSNRKPNFVFIVADQWRGDCLSGTGSDHPVITPHVSQIGCEGARFARATADCPICMPQRVTHLTGQVASRFGKAGNFHDRSPVDPASGLPGRLAREAGYQSYAVGKMHFFPSRARLGFDHVQLHPNDYVNWLESVGWGGAYRGHGVGGNEVVPVSADLPERFYHTHWIVDQAIDFLGRRDPECPFFLYVVFEAPHSPFDPPAPYDRMYDNFTIPEPVQADWLAASPPELAARRRSYNYDHLTPEMIAEARRRYYGQITHIDYQLGRLIGELKSRRLYDDTALVFTSDHGEHLGDHGVWHKGTFLHGSADVPLNLRFPAWVDGAPRAQVVDVPVLSADICPTLLELAGLAPDDDCDGVSLLQTLRTGRAPREITFGEIGQTAMATDGKHKYIWWAVGGVEQLFDEQADPRNLADLSGEPSLAETKRRLRSALTERLSRFNRPMVEQGRLVSRPFDDSEQARRKHRSANPFANRGPMRHGQGYYGNDG